MMRAVKYAMSTALILSAAVTSAKPFDHAHSAWTTLLTDHVANGAVDYDGLAKDRPSVKSYLRRLQAVSKSEFTEFSRDQKMAFWINAYNAYTIDLILENYPITSIKKIGRFWESPFKIVFIPLTKLRGEEISLNTIEHEILRADFPDARIHSAIVCASFSCPELRAEAYVAERLDEQLDDGMRRFVADNKKNRWDASSGTLHLSSIFKWFSDDFERDGGSLVNYVTKYMTPARAGEIRKAGTPKIKHLKYDWSLNDH